jgi:hypothetical protein
MEHKWALFIVTMGIVSAYALWEDLRLSASWDWPWEKVRK